MHAQGWNVTAIGADVGLGRRMVRNYLNRAHPSGSTALTRRRNKLDPDNNRWLRSGLVQAAHATAELVAHAGPLGSGSFRYVIWCALAHRRSICASNG